jgi:hypothetical protein
MYKITEIEVLENYKIALKFVDGAQGIVDLSYLVGKGVFSVWTDYDEFKKASIGPSGELLWGNKADLCPDTLYMKISGKRAEELFPSLKQASLHA